MLNVVKVRFYPNEEQITILSKTFGSCRFVYNYMLDTKNKEYAKTQINLGAFTLIKKLPIMKNSDFPWLKDVDSTSLQQTIKNMDKAFKGFFNGGGFPKFKSKHDAHQSYQTTTAKIKGDSLFLPKVGLVTMHGFRAFAGRLKTVTVSLFAGQYHASLIFDDGKEFKAPSHNNKVIGIDVGVVKIVTTSDNDMYEPQDLSKELESLKKAQKSLSRKKKASNNRAKAKLKVQRRHLKIVNKRKDFLHKLSNKITNENQVIVIEKLNVKNMTKSATGTIEEPKSSAGKRGLNRVITEKSWGLFFQMLRYKAIKKGGEVIAVDPKYTSQQCSNCGTIDKNNRKSQSRYECGECGFKINADYNAAINIKKRGLKAKVADLLSLLDSKIAAGHVV